MLPNIDLFLFDVKHMDSEIHRQLAGAENDLILENLTRINHHEKSIWIRIPLIPGYNDSMENLRNIADFAKRLQSVEKISLLPYNTAAGARYHCIGQHYGLENLSPHSKHEEAEFLELFSSVGAERFE
jgi:pyruvate formate lyase activating enzyme